MIGDQWIDLEAPKKQQTLSDPVVFGMIKQRGGDPKCSLSVAEAIMSDVGWPRYRVQWNRDRKEFRITGADDGRFEGFRPTKAANRIVIRFPVPTGAVFKPDKVAPTYELNKSSKTLTVRLPSRYWEGRP